MENKAGKKSDGENSPSDSLNKSPLTLSRGVSDEGKVGVNEDDDDGQELIKLVIGPFDSDSGY